MGLTLVVKIKSCLVGQMHMEESTQSSDVVFKKYWVVIVVVLNHVDDGCG